MTSQNAYPPTILHESTLQPVSIEDAQRIVEKYLKDSKRRPHLHPDAHLERNGPAFSVTGGSQGGVILHQLRRVEAGLRGEILEPEIGTWSLNGEISANDDGAINIPPSNDARLDAMIAAANAEMDAESSPPQETNAGKKRKADAIEVGDEGFTIANGTFKAADDEWQDPEVMDLQEDGAEAGDLDDHDTTVVADGGTVPALKSAGKIDKEARKKAKKERSKAERRQRAEKAAGRNGVAAKNVEPNATTADSQPNELQKEGPRANDESKARASTEVATAKKGEKEAVRQTETTANSAPKDVAVDSASRSDVTNGGLEKEKKKRHRKDETSVVEVPERERKISKKKHEEKGEKKHKEKGEKKHKEQGEKKHKAKSEKKRKRIDHDEG